MARPTDLIPELIGRAKVYLDTCKDDITEDKKSVNLPSIEGFARFLGVSRSTIYEWKKLDNEIGKQFSDILEEVFEEQGKRLINNGLSGNYNPTITKLILTKHGYIEKAETDLTTGGDKFTVNLMNYVDKSAPQV